MQLQGLIRERKRPELTTLKLLRLPARLTKWFCRGNTQQCREPSELVARFLNNIAIVASATAPIFAKRRRVNVCALARKSDNGSGAVPPQPFGPMGLRPNFLSLVVADANTSTPPRFAISARQPHRRLLCYLGSQPLEYPQSISVCYR